MALSYQDVASHPRRMLALTGYTQQEFVALLPQFVKEFITTMTTMTLQNTPRDMRAYSVYGNSPLPTMEDKLFFILVYLKQAPPRRCRAHCLGCTNRRRIGGFMCCMVS